MPEAVHQAGLGQRAASRRKRCPAARRRRRRRGAAHCRRNGRSRRRFWCAPGQAPRTLSQRRSVMAAPPPGAIGNGIGFDVYRLRPCRFAMGARRCHASARPAAIKTCCSRSTSSTLEGEAKDLQPRFTLADLAKTRSRPEQARRQSADALSAARLRHLRVGHGDRHRGLHRLQRLRRRLPGRKQRADRRAGRDRRRPRHALAAHRRLRRSTASRASRRCPACIASTRRASRSARWRPRSTTAKG